MLEKNCLAVELPGNLPITLHRTQMQTLSNCMLENIWAMTVHSKPMLNPTPTALPNLQTLYNCMLENNCSEQSSRMSAMENSTKNAGEMLGKVRSCVWL